MIDVTLEEVKQMIARLSPEDRTRLINEAKAGKLDQESLLGRYAKPRIYPSDKQLEASIKASATEWEQELDEFADDKRA